MGGRHARRRSVGHHPHSHTQPAGAVDTRIFVLDGEFTDTLLAELVGRLRAFVPGPIACGRWEYRSGNDFKLVLVQEFSPTGIGNTAQPNDVPDCGGM